LSVLLTSPHYFGDSAHFEREIFIHGRNFTPHDNHRLLNPQYITVTDLLDRLAFCENENIQFAQSYCQLIAMHAKDPVGDTGWIATA